MNSFKLLWIHSGSIWLPSSMMWPGGYLKFMSKDEPILTSFAVLLFGITVLCCLFCSLSKNCCFFFFHFWFYFIRQNGKSSPCYSTMLYKEVMRSEKVAGSEAICQRTQDSNNESSKILKPILQGLQIR